AAARRRAPPRPPPKGSDPAAGRRRGGLLARVGGGGANRSGGGRVPPPAPPLWALAGSPTVAVAAEKRKELLRIVHIGTAPATQQDARAWMMVWWLRAPCGHGTRDGPRPQHIRPWPPRPPSPRPPARPHRPRCCRHRHRPPWPIAARSSAHSRSSGCCLR